MEPIPESLWPWVVAWSAAVGAAVGSFLNVVVARVPQGMSVVRPRSRCPRCGAAIAWHDNVPVLSWLLLRGRCRACRERISLRYPLVEAATAVVAALAVGRHGLSGSAAAELAFVATLLALGLIDLDTWLLPHALTWPLLAGGIACAALGAAPAGSASASLLGAGLGFAAFATVALVGRLAFRREAMGFGDVWLLAGLGAFLGVKALLPVVLLASLQGVLVGVVLGMMGRLPRGDAPPAAAPAEGEASGADDDWVPPRNAVPFGPFLVAGALEWLYLGDVLARWLPALEIFR